ncbi:hypothetical protein MRX96_021445 [Rhipicephalus microplus]
MVVAVAAAILTILAAPFCSPGHRIYLFVHLRFFFVATIFYSCSAIKEPRVAARKAGKTNRFRAPSLLETRHGAFGGRRRTGAVRDRAVVTTTSFATLNGCRRRRRQRGLASIPPFVLPGAESHCRLGIITIVV